MNVIRPSARHLLPKAAFEFLPPFCRFGTEGQRFTPLTPDHMSRQSIRRVVERTFAWLSQFRRLRVRYDKRADIHEAFLSLACALICWQSLRKTWRSG
jgi:hypothetical protein